MPTTPASGATSPPPVPILDAEAFRRRLAGLEDPIARTAGVAGAANRAYLKETASRLCSILAHLYNVGGDNADRTQLWGHIGKALEVADEKTSDGDVEHFLSECQRSVQADPVKAAACGALTGLTLEMAAWPAEIRHDFLNYVRAHRPVVLTFGRVRWEKFKAKEIEL